MLCVDAVPASTSDRATFRSHHDWNSHDRVDSLRFVPLNRLVPFLHISLACLSLVHWPLAMLTIHTTFGFGASKNKTVTSGFALW
jgi:hypothetical protein